MIFKLILISLTVLKLIHSEKTFTIVIDTSYSMADELDIIKANLGSVIKVGDTNNINEYIVVPFSDPVVGTPTVTLTFNELLIAVNRIYLNRGRGGDCPEDSLSGIEKALQVSKPRSNIFLFTDAFPKDIDKIRSIESLCRNSLSQVVIFLTGFCPSLPLINVQAYYDVAKACSGTVLELNTSDLRKVFKYMKELIKVQWSDVVTYNTFTEYKEISFSVDTFTKSVLLVVSGKYIDVRWAPVQNSSSTFENILVSQNAQVIKLIEASPGNYTININCQGSTTLVIFKNYHLPLQIGFSTVQPRSIKETSRRPMPGRINYIFIDVLGDVKLDSIALQLYNEQNQNILTLEEPTPNNYLAKTFIDPEKSFRILTDLRLHSIESNYSRWNCGHFLDGIVIYGEDRITHQKVNASTESIIPQKKVHSHPKWTQPKVEIIEGTPITVKYGNKITLACKVVAYPKPSVWWEDNDSTLPASADSVLLEMPSLYINYYTFENVTSNATIYCKCRNSEGEASRHVDVYVYRPYTFEVLQTPQDQSIEYDSEGKLYCEVSAYPPAKIKWYHNDSIIIQSDNFEVIPEENALLIKNMNLNNVGDYKCEVSNTVNTTTYKAEITVSGIEAPEVEVDKSNVTLVRGDWTYLECRVKKGKPAPLITWKFKAVNDFDFDMLLDNVMIEDDKVKITAAQSEHNGIFRCYANNIEGEHTADIAVTVQYPPIIYNNETKELVVKEDDDVLLECDVTASPAATVWWEMSHDNVSVALDYRHRTDEHYTHRFKALGKDFGDYYCVAENRLGRVMKMITLKVLVKPYIEAPKSTRMTVRAGAPVNLTCNIIVGYPVPSTKWQFIALDSTTTILKRGRGSLFLQMPDVRHSNEGWYTCIADNDVGTDLIKIYLKVQ